MRDLLTETEAQERAGVADLTIQSISLALGGVAEWTDADTMDSYVINRAKDYRAALFLAGASCQGGHSTAGEMIAELLGIPFPLSMESLAAKAMTEGLNPNQLWPWLKGQRAFR